MSAHLTSFFRSLGGTEERFYVETSAPLTPPELEKLHALIADPDNPCGTRREPFYLHTDDNIVSVVEIGPRLNFETPDSSNAVAICRAMGLNSVTRIERAMRYPTDSQTAQMNMVAAHCDHMTQMPYPPEGIASFETGILPAPVRIIPVLEEGEAALRAVNKELGLGFDDWDIGYYTSIFKRYHRNPTDVEVFQIANANSEHCRHWLFKGRFVIDGVEMPESLLDLIQTPWRLNPGNSVLAFNDNAGVIAGYQAQLLVPSHPSTPSPYHFVTRQVDATSTAETHNHPTLKAPFPGGATGTGGRIRDNAAVGRGATPRIGAFGMCVGNLHIPGYPIPGETVGGEKSAQYASPLKVLIEGANGALGYGNAFGEPTVGGFTRSFGLMVGGERREFIKPILYSGGLGMIDHAHTTKPEPQPRMLIIRIGGPAYRVGVGGGAASSMMHGANDAELDLKSVQRGNPEMENRANRVFRACVDMGDDNPIVDTNDQGAGGPSNALSELTRQLGGKIDIRQIVVGDKTMSVLEIWSAEFQEGYGLLLKKDGLELFRAICERERVNCEVVGELTGDGKIVVWDSQNGETVVDLNLDDVLTGIPRKTFNLERIPRKLEPLKLPENLIIEDALKAVLRLPQVGSKGFKVRKVDCSVGGLVVQQHYAGCNMIPIADAFVVADGYVGSTGAVTAIGEQPNKLLIDSAAGVRMAVAEMLTNMCGTRISRFEDISCRVNWMWPAKLPGEGARLYDAVVALRDALTELGIKADGGKDSSSMAATVNGATVKSPDQMVIKGYAPVPDVTKVITPAIKRPGESTLAFIDISGCRNVVGSWLYRHRLGGSALAQAFGQVGDESPDVDLKLVKRVFLAIQQMIDEGLILALHDRSDGGLIVAVAEMCMASGCGFTLDSTPYINELFCEEAGVVLEILTDENVDRIAEICDEFDIPFMNIGVTNVTEECSVTYYSLTRTEIFWSGSITQIRQWWEETSSQLELLQANPETVVQEKQSFTDPCAFPKEVVSFEPRPTPPALLSASDRPKVAILREEGTNGDKELAAAFYLAGLDPWDVHMSDLLAGRITLDQFQGVGFPGGFSFKDVFGSGKGQAAVINFNPLLREQFDRFYNRPDTFSLGVCNGCQLMALLGWAPFKLIEESRRPRFLHNTSGRFESRRVQVEILPSPAIMFKGMVGSCLNVWAAHGEGRLFYPDQSVEREVHRLNLASLAFLDSDTHRTDQYPYNPNGSPHGRTALCSPDGRHLAMMPHPERCCFSRNETTAKPWLRMFQNARDWCMEHRRR